MAGTLSSKSADNSKVYIATKNVKGKLGTRHIQAFLLFLGMVMAFATRSSMSVAIVAMKDEKPPNPEYPRFDWKDESQYIQAGSIVGLAIAQIPFGYVATVKSAHKLHSCGMFLSGILHALVPLMAIYGNWFIVCIGRFFMGVCQASLMSCNQILLSRWSPPFERSRLAMFVFNGALMGTVITMPISGILAPSRFGWPSIFYLFGSLTSVWAVIFFLFGADSPAKHTSISSEERLYIEASLGKNANHNESQKLVVPWKAILTSVPMWCLFLSAGGHNWGFNFLITQLPAYMKEALNFDLKSSGIISALPYLCAWLLAFPFSWITDYFLKRGTSATVVRKVANSVSMWGPALAMVALCFVGKDRVMAVTIMVVGVSLNSGVFAGFQVTHIEMSPNFAGTMMSITNCFGNCMGFLAPMVTGWIVKDQKSLEHWNIIFYLTAFLYFSTNAAFLLYGTAKKQLWNEIGFTRTDVNKNNTNSPEINVRY